MYSQKLRKMHRKHLCQSLFFNNVAGLRSATLLKKGLWHWCFPVNFAKFLRTPFLQNTYGRLLLTRRTMLARHIPDIIIIFSLEQIMVHKCAAPSCRSGYAKNETKHITKFHFPLKNFELNRLQIRFVDRKYWKPAKHSVL